MMLLFPLVSVDVPRCDGDLDFKIQGAEKRDNNDKERWHKRFPVPTFENAS